MIEPIKSIMVVDDEPGRLRLICLFLKRAGFLPLPVRTATTAIEALELLIPDLFVVSADLDDGSGQDLCRQIRISPLTASAPVLMLMMRGDDYPSQYDTLVDDALNIPFVSHELIERIRCLFAVREAI